jgi:hypothetical protein
MIRFLFPTLFTVVALTTTLAPLAWLMAGITLVVALERKITAEMP